MLQELMEIVKLLEQTKIKPVRNSLDVKTPYLIHMINVIKLRMANVQQMVLIVLDWPHAHLTHLKIIA